MLSILKHHQPLIISSLLLIAGLSSCTAPKAKSSLAEYGPVFETIMITDMGAFRGFSLGDKLDSIQAKEKAKLIEADDLYLYYQSKIDDTTGTYNISYTFDEMGLNEIQSDIFLTNADQADGVFNTFKTYFDEHYGSSESHMGFNVWTVRSDKYGVIRINLSDESDTFITDKPPGKISLWIYPDKE